MKSLLSLCAILSFACSFSGYAQQPLRMVTASSASGDEKGTITLDRAAFSSSVSFHHVWATDVKYGYFRSNGLDLYYEMEGRGNETVIVVHGCPGIPHDYLHPMLSNLGNHLRVVYFDRRFDGLPKGLPREAMSIRSMTEDLNVLRETLGLERVTLLAHGFGGLVALNYSLRYPARVKRLVLVGTSGSLESGTAIERRLLESLSPEEQTTFKSVQESPSSQLERDRKRYRILYPHCFLKPPDSDMQERDTYYLYFDALARKYALANDPDGFDLRTELDKIKVPVLVLCGRYDRMTPLTLSNELAKGLPHVRLAVMERSGHFPQFEEGYLFTEWVRGFIADTWDQQQDLRTTTVASPSAGPR